MKHNFTKNLFSDYQLKLILMLKDLLTSSNIPDDVSNDVYYIATGYEHVKDISLQDRVKIGFLHNRYCESISEERIVKIKLYNCQQFIAQKETLNRNII